MKAVVQRVLEAKVEVGNEVVARIGPGILVFASFGPGDERGELEWMASKILSLRIFEDAGGKMNLSLRDVGGELPVVPNFTLHGDCRRGRRPSFDGAAPPQTAEALFRGFLELLQTQGLHPQAGIFGAHMRVTLTNDGPVTFVIDSPGETQVQ
ncbi:MAG: D-aminoacyl-tRNA deacylase [Armatimonadetes bacterium]|nr:D-aminoacyl-tRNA deacylase [Armatimonadota bacterium]